MASSNIENKRSEKSCWACGKSSFSSRQRLDFALTVALAVLLATALAMFPEQAFAAPTNEIKSVGFASIVAVLQDLLTTKLLPIAIVIAGWKILYLALFCGIAGYDPLNQLVDRDADGTVDTADVFPMIKDAFANFARACIWIGGVWILFSILLGFASMFAGQIAQVFGS